MKNSFGRGKIKLYACSYKVSEEKKGKQLLQKRKLRSTELTEPSLKRCLGYWRYRGGYVSVERPGACLPGLAPRKASKRWLPPAAACCHLWLPITTPQLAWPALAFPNLSKGSSCRRALSSKLACFIWIDGDRGALLQIAQQVALKTGGFCQKR